MENIKQIPCEKCDGSGNEIIGFDDWTYENIEQTCAECGGTGYHEGLMVFIVDTEYGKLYVTTLREMADTLDNIYFWDDDPEIKEDYIGGNPIKFSLEVQWVTKKFYENLEPFEL